MDVQTFVREALIQIARAVDDAERELGNTAAIVNPKGVHTWVKEGIATTQYVEGFKGSLVQPVEFDVEVFAEHASSADGGAKLQVGFVSLGGKGEASDRRGSASRIRFTVPLLLRHSERAPARRGQG